MTSTIVDPLREALTADPSATADAPVFAGTSGIRPWEAYRESAERPNWLIEGLLPTTFTDLSGSKGAGKTLFAAHLAAAVATGAPECLGRLVKVHGRVLVATSDVGEEAAWCKRLTYYQDFYGYRPNVDIAVPGPGSQWWSTVLRWVERHKPVLVVVDHCAGMLREMGTQADLNSAADAELLLGPLTRIVRLGTAVLMLGHSSAPQVHKGKEVGGGKRTMGSIQWGATTRQSVHLDNTVGPNTVKVCVSGRTIAPFEAILDVEYDEQNRTAAYEVVHDQINHDKRARSKDTAENRAAWGRKHVIGNPLLKDAPTRAEVARVLAAVEGQKLTESGLKTKIRRALEQLPHAQYVPGEGWQELDA